MTPLAYVEYTVYILKYLYSVLFCSCNHSSFSDLLSLSLAILPRLVWTTSSQSLSLSDSSFNDGDLGNEFLPSRCLSHRLISFSSIYILCQRVFCMLVRGGAYCWKGKGLGQRDTQGAYQKNKKTSVQVTPVVPSPKPFWNLLSSYTSSPQTSPLLVFSEDLSLFTPYLS